MAEAPGEGLRQRKPDEQPTQSATPAQRPVDTTSGGTFDCNVCLDEASQPVVTLCGHLYCWPCLYRWLQTGNSTCPVCKAGVTAENVIPVYGRGGAASANPRAQAQDIPHRPAGQRPAAPPPPPFGGGAGVPHMTVAQGMFGGLFPPLFSLQFHTLGGNQGAPTTPAEAHNQFVSRLLAIVGFSILAWLLFM